MKKLFKRCIYCEKIKFSFLFYSNGKYKSSICKLCDKVRKKVLAQRYAGYSSIWYFKNRKRKMRSVTKYRLNNLEWDRERKIQWRIKKLLNRN